MATKKRENPVHEMPLFWVKKGEFVHCDVGFTGGLLSSSIVPFLKMRLNMSFAI